MNKLSIVKKIALSAGILFSTFSCVNNDDFELPPVGELECNSNVTTNTTLGEVLSKYVDDGGATTEINEDAVFEAYVISNDKGGNFYKSLVIQDATVNPTAGVQIEVDLQDYFDYYPVGSKIFVDAKGLFIAKDRGVIKIGGKQGKYPVERLDAKVLFNHVKRSCDQPVEIVPTAYTSIKDAKKNENINLLIRLEGVQFKDADGKATYYDSNNAIGGATNVKIEDKEGNTLDLRNGDRTDWKAEILPNGSGSITLILSKYNTSYQSYIRSLEDVKLDQPRLNAGEGEEGGETPGEITYLTSLNEDFNSYDKHQDQFDTYQNTATEGNRKWRVDEYSGNKFLSASAYNGPTSMKAYFIMPVDFSAAKKNLSFKINLRYYKGAPLKVYYTTNYTKAGVLTDLIDITSQFTIPTGDTNGFKSAGTYNLSGISGKGAIVFEYNGSKTDVTTTVQLDDIMIAD